MPRNKLIQQAIIKTVCYADVFNYPLTTTEISRYLIWDFALPPPSKKQVLTEIKEFSRNIISRTNGYYFLNSRSHLVALRRKRMFLSNPKLKIARRVGNWLKLIPSVKAVAVTGALAMRNSGASDDIDLLIITQNNRLWLTRIMVVTLVSLIAKRRTPLRFQSTSTTKQFKNLICLNLFLDEVSLEIPPKKRNLYTAHELAQTKFLWHRNNLGNKYLSENIWLNNYLPHVKIRQRKEIVNKNKKTASPLSYFNPLFFLLEIIAFKIQFIYMKQKITREVVTFGRAFFHPRNTGPIILKKYSSRVKSLKLARNF